ncbi:MAG: GNAT family N-acetyltransferase [Chloroflexota bacterium]
MKSVVVKPLEEKYLDKVVRIHQDVLGYTFNSRLGYNHLAFMYRIMARFDEAYVRVAFVEDQPVGVISGTLDVDKTRSVIFRSFKRSQWMNLAKHLLKRPSLIAEWWKGNMIGRTVYFEGFPVKAILTTIAIDPKHQGKGIGKCMVNALESYFKLRNIQYYLLDTLSKNIGAREFYKSLGFQQVEIRADSIIFVKGLFDR